LNQTRVRNKNKGNKRENIVSELQKKLDLETLPRTEIHTRNSNQTRISLKSGNVVHQLDIPTSTTVLVMWS